MMELSKALRRYGLGSLLEDLPIIGIPIFVESPSPRLLFRIPADPAGVHIFSFPAWRSGFLVVDTKSSPDLSSLLRPSMAFFPLLYFSSPFFYVVVTAIEALWAGNDGSFLTSNAIRAGVRRIEVHNALLFPHS